MGETLMQAIVYHRYGAPDVLKLQEIDKPTIPDDQLLVRVHAASLNAGDWHSLTGLYIARTQLGWRKPKNTRLGSDFA
jgi:NADPH:quinone reductase-like Zn-dependent oxidoreductase